MQWLYTFQMAAPDQSEHTGTRSASSAQTDPAAANRSPDAGEEKSSAPARESWGWTRRQRAGLGVLLALFLGVLTYQYVRWPARLDDPVVVVDGQSVSLPAQINPNAASQQELARIPHIGDALAGKIIAYRDARVSTAAGGVVFRQLSDLDAVPGIGKKVLEQISPFLDFPEAASEPSHP